MMLRMKINYFRFLSENAVFYFELRNGNSSKFHFTEKVYIKNYPYLQKFMKRWDVHELIFGLRKGISRDPFVNSRPMEVCRVRNAATFRNSTALNFYRALNLKFFALA
jgi:hypothetical protein